jgi:hypothetical protein
MTNTASKWIALTLLLTLALLPGCSLTNPYVTWDRPTEPQPASISLPYAIAYAKNARDKYREALSDRAKLTNLLGPGLITLSAIVLGQAAFGASKDAILGTGLGAATAYVIGNWFSNRSSDIVYLAGMEAMNCAVDAVLPLNFSDAVRNSLNADLGELSNSITSANQAIGNVQSLIPLVENTHPLNQQARADVAKAEKVIETADQAYSPAQILLRHVDTVGTNLVSAVDRIGVAVDKALQQTQPRLESLVNVISQLSGASNIFAPGLGLAGTLAEALQPKEPKAKGQPIRPEQLSPEEQLEIALGNLAAQSAALASWTRRVASVVNSVNETRPLQTLKECGVNVDKVDTDITVSSTLIQFPSDTPGERAVIVQGGKSPYVGRFLESPTPGVTLENPIPGDKLIRVKVAEKTPAMSYTLLVGDAAGHSKIVTVTILGKPTGANGKDNKDGSPLKKLADQIKGKQFKADNDSFKIDEAMVVDDKKVEVTVSPVQSGTTIPAKEKLIAGIGEIKSDGRTIKEIFTPTLGDLNQVLSLAASPKSAHFSVRPNRFGPTVARMATAKVARVQVALCIDQKGTDGKWGDMTQRTLENWRMRNNPKAKNEGPLTENEMNTLMSLSPKEIAEQCK